MRISTSKSEDRVISRKPMECLLQMFSSSRADWKETREPQSALNYLKHDSTCKKTFSCSECVKRFGFKSDLKKHMRTHTGEKPFSCSICKKYFTQSGYLQQHMRIHTGEKPFSCSVCNKSFTQSGYLQQHMRIHTGEKPFSCSVCNTSFTHSGHLKSHRRTHTGEKPFSCLVCNKSFTQSGSLQKHMRIHTGEKPFCCSECGKAFTERGTLKTHMTTHSGEKPFSCSVCKKSFTHSGALKIHMRIHTGEKPFSCSVCKKSFTQSGHLRLHMAVHTGDRRFSCSVCNRRFAWRSDVKTHKCVGQMENPAARWLELSQEIQNTGPEKRRRYRAIEQDVDLNQWRSGLAMGGVQELSAGSGSRCHWNLTPATASFLPSTGPDTHLHWTPPLAGLLSSSDGPASSQKPPDPFSILETWTPPPVSLGNAREDELHAWILQVEVLQVLLHSCDDVDALDISQVIPATVNKEDIRGCSSL
ncbi:zinc finger protein 501-like [Perca fluviatilis]|uniref:zinc finger protein 501-like n=1 Tax=Perca fluviatilis TaxID=8168 RepID=UPI001962F9D3|nr:zinc finger protein 501-like [Perca fluviatilis]